MVGILEKLGSPSAAREGSFHPPLAGAGLAAPVGRSEVVAATSGGDRRQVAATFDDSRQAATSLNSPPTFYVYASPNALDLFTMPAAHAHFYSTDLTRGDPPQPYRRVDSAFLGWIDSRIDAAVASGRVPREKLDETAEWYFKIRELVPHVEPVKPPKDYAGPVKFEGDWLDENDPRLLPDRTGWDELVEIVNRDDRLKKEIAARKQAASDERKRKAAAKKRERGDGRKGLVVGQVPADANYL